MFLSYIATDYTYDIAALYVVGYILYLYPKNL